MDSRKYLALSLCFLFLFPDLSHSNIQLPGWLGDNKMQGSVLKLKKGVSSATFDPSRVTQLSWHPRAFLYKGFLSDEECDHLINVARDKLEKSMVADNESGKSIMSEVRTSSGMFLRKYQDEVVADIEARIAAWTFLPIENGEAMQVLHYLHGEKYEPHFDYFHDKENQKLGGHRVATVLMYLSNVEKGGETVFPNAESKVSQPKDDDVSDCAKNGYAVKPKKGDALLFFSLNPDATTDTRSLHGSCPVIEGEKWSATKWIHVRSFEKPNKQEGMGGKGDCVDENENCPVWAKAGLNRCGKSCRLRWTNYLRSDLKHDGFTPEEEELIINLHKAIGSRWSLIAKRLPGRTDNDVKNYWNTKLRKKLSKMGIDPVTHKPYSQILSDYGNISGILNIGNQIGPLNINKNLNYAPTPKPEPSSVLTSFPNTNMPMEFQNIPYNENIVPSLDFMSHQFQQVNINQETIQPHFFNEATSSCSSSSSSNVTQLSPLPQSYSCQPSQVQNAPSSSFNWSEFLITDPLPFPGFQQQQDRHFPGFSSSTNPSTFAQTPPLNFASGNEYGLNQVGQEEGIGNFDVGSTIGGHTNNNMLEVSSSVSSFVNSILDKDSEMQAEFPDILDESFDY